MLDGRRGSAAPLGFASHPLDPAAGRAQAAPLGAVLVALGIGLRLLPASPLPNRFGDTHLPNGPCWSLLQEYACNFLYALVLRHLTARALDGVAVASGVVLVPLVLLVAWAATDSGTSRSGGGRGCRPASHRRPSRACRRS